MKNLIIQINEKKNTDGSRDVRWVKRGEKELVGFGFQSKDGIAIIRCPSCGSENYMPMLNINACAKCGFVEEGNAE